MQCDLVASNFQDELLFHLDTSFRRILSVEYKVPTRCSDKTIPSYESSSLNFKTTVIVEAPAEGRR